jgi:hypothetical protein
MDHEHPQSEAGAGPGSRSGSVAPAADARWEIPDLIDLEYYLDRDEQELREHPSIRNTFAERDREIYLQRPAPAVAGAEPHTPRHRRASLRSWLEARREAELPEVRAVLPGTAFARAQRLGIVALAVIGFLIGVGAASALLSYEGQRPVNVSWYILVLVGGQFIVIIGSLIAWAVRRSRAFGAAIQDITLLGRFIRPMLTRLGRWLQRQRLAHVSQEVREQVVAGKGMVKAHYALYGPVSYLAVLVPAQVFGVAFNVGVILATLSLEWFTDLAFGWGSTLNVDPHVIYHLAQGIATPWRWLFGEGVGYPSLDHVAGSRIVLKDPLSLLHAENLRSWRWFLVLSVFTYGMLPRLALLGASIYAQRHLFRRLSFTHGRTQALYARLITPRLETGAAVSGRGTEMAIPAPIAPHGPRPRRAPRPTAEAAATPAEPTYAESPKLPPTRVLAARLAPIPPSAPEQAPRLEGQPQGAEEGGAIAREAQEGAMAPAPEPAEGPGPQAAAEASDAAAERDAPQREATAEPELQAEPEIARPSISRPEPVPGEHEAEPHLQAEHEAEADQQRKPQAEPIAEVERAPETLPEAASARELAPTQLPPEPVPQPAPTAEPEAEQAEPAREIGADACLLLMHVDVDELITEEDRPRLARMLMAQTGWRVAGAASFGSGTAMTEGVVRWVEEQNWQPEPPRLAIVMDGSQPPITENLRFLRELRAAAGLRAQILLALVGDPANDDPLPPVRTFDFADWQRKIDAMGDPYLRLEMLAPPAREGEV